MIKEFGPKNGTPSKSLTKISCFDSDYYNLNLHLMINIQKRIKGLDLQ